MQMKDVYIDPLVKRIMDMLEFKGYAAYYVGGGLRDFFLKREKTDYDIATSATVEEMKEIFKDFNINTKGAKYGNIRIEYQEEENSPMYQVEITTFRKEGTYFDFRHPSEVEFVDDIYIDLNRRDFTVNAMAYNPKTGLIDPYDGLNDIRLKRLRTIGSPMDKFEEDALRMMRAVRFSAQLNFDIEEETFDAIKINAHLIGKIGRDRIKDEFSKLILSNHPAKGVRLLLESGLLEYVLPDLPKSFELYDKISTAEGAMFEHLILILDASPKVLEARIAALLHDMHLAILTPHTFDENTVSNFRTNMIFMILKYLRYNKSVIDTVNKYVQYMDTDLSKLNKEEKNKFLSVYKREELHIAKELKALNDMYSLKNNVQKLYAGSDFKSKDKKRELITKKQLNISGYDIMKIGFSDTQIGEIINVLYKKVLDNDSLNKKNILKAEAEKMYEQKCGGVIMNYDQIIRNLKSTRDFKEKQVDRKVLEDFILKAKAQNLPYEGSLSFNLVYDAYKVTEDMKGKTGYYGKLIKAPHYIALIGEDYFKNKVDTGYALEYIRFLAEDSSIGTCWLEVSNDKALKTALGAENGEILAILAIGYPYEGFFKKDIEHKSERNSPSDIVFNEKWNENMLWEDLYNRGLGEEFSLVRYAPSSKNEQPWQFVLKDDKIILAVSKKSEFALETGIIMLYVETVFKSHNIKRIPFEEFRAELTKDVECPDDYEIRALYRI